MGITPGNLEVAGEAGPVVAPFNLHDPDRAWRLSTDQGASVATAVLGVASARAVSKGSGTRYAATDGVNSFFYAPVKERFTASFLSSLALGIC